MIRFLSLVFLSTVLLAIFRMTDIIQHWVWVFVPLFCAVSLFLGAVILAFVVEMLRKR